MENFSSKKYKKLFPIALEKIKPRNEIVKNLAQQPLKGGGKHKNKKWLSKFPRGQKYPPKNERDY